MRCRRGEDAIDAGIGGIGRSLVPQEYADSHRAFGRSPLGDRIDHGGVGRIDRLDQPETVGVRRVNLERIARVETVHAERRDQDRAIDAGGIHRGHHLVAGDLRRPVESADPGAAGVVAFVGVNLCIQYRHDLKSS